MSEPFSVYSTWGYHDELGDRVELDEQMALAALDTLERWRRDHGVGFDYFQLDCMWFDPAAGYRKFRHPNWPDGFGRVRERIESLGMKPGLWYSVGGGPLHVPDWQDSLAADNWHYSLADGSFAGRLGDAMLAAAEQWGVRYFKLDFAAFTSAAADVDRPEDQTYHLSIRRLKDVLRRLRDAHPDVNVIAHCGFARAAVDPPLGTPYEPSVDASWLEVLDRMFSGDPRPSDVPQTVLARSIDLYQDRQVWKLSRDGFPLDRVEDHGVMVGRTNTCFYRGRTGFRRSHLAQLARGGRRDMLYGDPTLLTGEDVEGIRPARALFFDAYRRSLATTFVGPGEPGAAPWHGFLTGGGDRGLLYAVSPGGLEEPTEVTVPGLFKARVLFHDGPECPVAQVRPDLLRLRLWPEQAALIGLGAYAEADYMLGPDAEPPGPRAMEPLAVRLDMTADDQMTGEVTEAMPVGSHLWVTARALGGPAAANCPALPVRFAQQNTKDSTDMTPAARDLLRIEVTTSAGRLSPLRRVPDVPVWSGISWVAAEYAVSGPCRVTVASRVRQAREVEVKAYAVSR
jgi:hypothetical protein